MAAMDIMDPSPPKVANVPEIVHPQTKTLIKITHLIFANNLFPFSASTSSQNRDCLVVSCLHFFSLVLLVFFTSLSYPKSHSMSASFGVT